MFLYNREKWHIFLLDLCVVNILNDICIYQKHTDFMTSFMVYIMCIYRDTLYLYCLLCSATETSHNATKSPITGIRSSPSRICTARKLECSEYGSSPRKNSNNFSYGVIREAVDNGDRTVLLDTPKIIALLSQGLNAREHWIKLGKGSFGTVIQAKHKGLYEVTSG